MTRPRPALCPRRRPRLLDAGERQLVVLELGRVRADGLHLPHLLRPEGAQRIGLGLRLGGRLLGVAAAL